MGTLGNVGVLSFDQGKMIATGEGGMLLTNNYETDQYARQYHDHGHENNISLPRGRDNRTRVGFNYRMTEMQAAVGKVQLSKLNRMLYENKKDIRFYIQNWKINLNSALYLKIINLTMILLY